MGDAAIDPASNAPGGQSSGGESGDPCRVDFQTIRLSGTVSSEAPEPGTIRLDASERGTLVCGVSAGSVAELSPGVAVAHGSIPGPGAFDLGMEVSSVYGVTPDLQLRVFADRNDDGYCDTDEPSTLLTIDGTDHRSMDVVLDGYGCLSNVMPEMGVRAWTL